MGLFLNQNIDGDDKQEGVQKVMGDYVYKFWHLLDETLNAILFILIGLEIIPILQNFDISYLLISCNINDSFFDFTAFRKLFRCTN